MEILLANRPMIMAVPETTLTLLLFNFEAMPAASRLTVLFFRSIIFPMLTLVSLVLMPYLSLCSALSYSLALYNIVFVGMQPSLRHTPPSFFLKENCLQFLGSGPFAAMYPPGPLPIIAKSNICQ